MAAPITESRQPIALTPRQRKDKRHVGLINNREAFIPHWRKLSQFTSPRRGSYMLKTRKEPNRGGVMNEEMVDGAANKAGNVLASGMLSGLTSPTRPWVRVKTQDPQLWKYGPVSRWLKQLERIAYQVMNSSNLYTTLPSLYTELGHYATGCVMAEKDLDTVLHFRHFTIGSYSLGMDRKRRMNTMYREVQMTASQIIEQFGPDRASTAVRNSYYNSSGEDYFDVIHAIEPNVDRSGGYGNQDMPISSCWWEKDSKEVDFLRQSGYERFPVMAPIWEDISASPYGDDCPGMSCLGEIIGLQKEQKYKLEGIMKKVKPPLKGPMALRGHQVSHLAGEITYLNETQTTGELRKLYDVDFDLRELREEIAEVRASIGRYYHEDLFLMLTQSDRRQITAREIVERHEEKLLMLGPVLERLIDDLLDPLLDLVVNAILEDPRELIDPPPQELQGQQLSFDYVSILAQAQKAVGIQSVERYWSSAMAMAEFKPEVKYKLDAFETMDELGDMYGVPANIIVDTEEAQQAMEAEQAAQAEERAAAMSREQAEQAQIAGDTPVDGGASTVLDAMLNGVPAEGVQ